MMLQDTVQREIVRCTQRIAGKSKKQLETDAADRKLNPFYLSLGSDGRRYLAEIGTVIVTRNS